jgi:ribosome-associated protein
MSELNVNLETLLAIIDANHAVDVVVIDVKDQTSITDYMIVCSGRSSRQVRAIAENLMTEMKQRGLSALGYHGLDEGEWALIDFADFVVHVMQPTTRDFYNLEDLWQKKSV